MASLVSKDSYLQSLGRKVCAQPGKEMPKRKAAFKSQEPAELSGPKKKKKQRKSRSERGIHATPHRRLQGTSGYTDHSLYRGPPIFAETAVSSFSTVDLLRKCLREKIEVSRGQVPNKTLSIDEIDKRRQRRKQERERKKRKRKELRMKVSQEIPAEEEEEKKTEDLTEDTARPPLVFNKVEVHDEPLNKVMNKKQKKQSVKGNITPMTGKNYKQLLSRLEARKSKLEALRAKDQEKAKEFENKMKWTNVLYKAEGLKIKDDEGMLRTALKRKEKQKEQRKKRWDKRIENTAAKMQQRQEKRSRNIKKKKMAAVEKKKNRARKRGRIMPEDLAKSNVK